MSTSNDDRVSREGRSPLFEDDAIERGRAFVRDQLDRVEAVARPDGSFLYGIEDVTARLLGKDYRVDARPALYVEVEDDGIEEDGAIYLSAKDGIETECADPCGPDGCVCLRRGFGRAFNDRVSGEGSDTDPSDEGVDSEGG